MRLRNSAVLLFGCLSLALAQETRPNIRVDTNLVLIPITVITPANRFVTGLEKQDFRLFEDKVEQEITFLAGFDAPLSVGLIFDCSGTMSNKLVKARQAATEFFKTANPEDEFFLIQFSERPVLTTGLTRAPEDVQHRLLSTQARGRTALLDGIYMGLAELKKSNNPRKALLILSDGGDNSSRYTQTEVRQLLKEADAQLYAIGIFAALYSPNVSAEELAGPGLLSDLAESTGGRHFPVVKVNELPDIAAKIGLELRNQYVIGYVSRNQARDGKYRRVKVELKQPRGLPPLRAFYRLGYYAPTQ